MENATSVAGKLRPIQWWTMAWTRVITHMLSSPDDKFVVYVNQPSNGPGAHVHTIDTTTNKIVKSTAIDEEIVDLKVSPDSKTLIRALGERSEQDRGYALSMHRPITSSATFPWINAKLLATPRIRSDAIYVLTATSDSSAAKHCQNQRAWS